MPRESRIGLRGDQMDRKEAPGRIWYVVAVAIFVSGFIAMGGFMMPRLFALEGELIQVVVPGEAELTLDNAGTYTIFRENPSVVNGEMFSAPLPTGLRVSVTSAQTGEALVLTTSTSSSYSFGSRVGVSMFAFEVKEPGRYRLAARYSDGRSEPRTVIAVAHGFLSKLMTMILVSLTMAFGGAAIGVIIAVVVWRRRKAAGL